MVFQGNLLELKASSEAITNYHYSFINPRLTDMLKSPKVLSAFICAIAQNDLNLAVGLVCVLGMAQHSKSWEQTHPWSCSKSCL